MKFTELDLPDYLQKPVECYITATPIQQEAIPVIQAGKDVIAKAQTGTGKTAAFALPIIQQIVEGEKKKKKQSVLALVLAPTRELAQQVSKSFKKYAKHAPREVKVTTLIGGEDIDQQISDLRRGIDIAVATPGRLLDLIDSGEIRLFELQTLVLDEADKMLDLGFSQELEDVFELLPTKRQSLLFSATFPKKVLALAEKLLIEPVEVSVSEDSLIVEGIHQRAIHVDGHKRRALLQELLKTEKWEQVLVFVASKRAASNLADKLWKAKVSVTDFHGDLDQEERRLTLNEFKKKKTRVLIATDLAARGLDIRDLPCVINYDLPRAPMDYVHRIGRTGRAGQEGVAISFIDQETEWHFRTIENKIDQRIPRELIEGFELDKPIAAKPKGPKPVKGKGKSKKDKLREAARRQGNKPQD